MMEKSKFMCILLITVSLLTGCGKNGMNSSLNNVQVTQYGEMNFLTYPSFYFEYPNGWQITNEEVTPTTEKIELSNENGTTITYWNFGEMRELIGPTRAINTVEVTKVADSDFKPSYVQGTDYSELGDFMVAKLKVIEKCDMLGSGDSIKIDDGVERYAILPKSQIGTQTENIIVGLPTFSFWYSGHISLIAESASGKFTKQEEKDIIEILSSFNHVSENEEILKKHESKAINTIDKLWKKLEGRWKFEDYTYLGKPSLKTGIIEMKLDYVDDNPCMIKKVEVTNEDGIIEDKTAEKIEYFIDFRPVDVFHYNAYVSEKCWYSFDLSNIKKGELIIVVNYLMDSGNIDEHIYRYGLIE